MRANSSGLTVLSVTPFFLPVIGGVESVVYETSLGMIRNGHRPIVLTSTVRGRPKREFIEGVQVIRAPELDVPEDGIVNPSTFEFNAASDLFRRVVEEFNVDIMHVHNYQMKQYAMFLFSLIRGIDSALTPLVGTIHNNTDDPFAHYLFSYLPFSKVVALTSKSAFDLVRGGVPSTKIEVIPNLIDTRKFREADGRLVRSMLGVDMEPVIMFPSRLVGREKNLFKHEDGKGLHVLLRALPLIGREIPNVKLLLMGNDPVYPDAVAKAREGIIQFASTLGLKDSILFFDRDIPQQQLPSIFAASDVVVSLGPTESFGMVFLEAMAAGKPVVGVNSFDNGVPEVVLDGRAGFLVPPNDPWNTAKVIIKLLSDSQLARNVGREALQWVRKTYDVNAVLPRLIELYERCIKRGKQPSLEAKVSEPQTAAHARSVAATADRVVA